MVHGLAPKDSFGAVLWRMDAAGGGAAISRRDLIELSNYLRAPDRTGQLPRRGPQLRTRQRSRVHMSHSYRPLKLISSPGNATQDRSDVAACNGRRRRGVSSQVSTELIDPCRRPPNTWDHRLMRASAGDLPPNPRHEPSPSPPSTTVPVGRGAAVRAPGPRRASLRR